MNEPAADIRCSRYSHKPGNGDCRGALYENGTFDDHDGNDSGTFEEEELRMASEGIQSGTTSGVDESS